MIKSKKQMFMVIGSFVLIMLLGTITYAFFNYTRTGTANRISVGKIYFNTNQNGNINLTNMFPIETNSTNLSDPTKVGMITIDVGGDTTYDDGIEYVVSAVNVNNKINGKHLPISIDVSYGEASGETIGTLDDDYFTNRGGNTSIYKVLAGDSIKEGAQLLVGYIAKGETGINGTIMIKAYIDEDKIAISDTYPSGNVTYTESSGETSIEVVDYTNDTTSEWIAEREVFTTSEWNSLHTNGISFKIKVEANEGIWVDDPMSLYSIMKNNSVMDNIQSTYVSSSTGINFGEISSDTNGKGIYMRAGTENDAHPIVYYRGNIDNNNVSFNNKCWKAVITTDTGGVKLIYNGEAKNSHRYVNGEALLDSDINYTNDSDYPYVFDTSTKKWTSGNAGIHSSTGTFIFHINESNNYFVDYDLSSEANYDKVKIYKNDSLLKEDSGINTDSIYLGNLTTSDEIKIEYVKDWTGVAGDDIVSFKIVKNLGDLMPKSICDKEGAETFISISGTKNFTYNDEYNSPAYVGYMYGDIYVDKSEIPSSGAYFGSGFIYENGVYKLTNTSTTLDSYHHYTCNLTTAEGTCATIRYYYYNNSYINLTGGDSIEKAMEKMQTNTNNSNAKTQIDTWYASNMNNVTNKLEDTIWCNDRSFGDGNNNGLIANGGDLSTPLYYGAHERSNDASNTSAVKNKPSLLCQNINDRFTVNNSQGNRKLTYPVALLTADEMVLAGGSPSGSSTFYLQNAEWSMSPYSYPTAHVFSIFSSRLDINDVDNYDGIRPSISLKPGTIILSGTGIENDPYVIE